MIPKREKGLKKNNEIVKQESLGKDNGIQRQEKLKKALIKYYEPPTPQRKQAFIRQMGIQKINLLHLVGMQAKYISKWVWIVSMAFCGVTYGITYGIQETIAVRYVSMIVAFLPFLVMLSITESVHSYRYNMEELELSARFSLKSIVMARLLILGIGNGIVLLFASLLLENKADFHMLYIATPYFLTTGGGLFIVRNVRGNENTFFCFLLAATVSSLQMLLPWQFGELFLPKFLPVWAMVCITGIIVTVKESYRTIRMMEELAWN